MNSRLKSYIAQFTTLVVTACATSVNAATEWAQYKGNPQHTAYQSVTLKADAEMAWSLNIAGGISGFAAADGNVFITSNGYFTNQNLTAVDALSGNETWSKDFGRIFSVNPPSISNGIVYLQTGNHASDTYLRGYDATDGALKLKSSFSAQWERYQSPTIYEGNAYINGGSYGGAYSFNLQDGNQNWFTNLEQYDGWTPAINEDYLVTYTGGNLRELDRNTGFVIQTISTSAFNWGGWTSTTPILINDTAYVNDRGSLISFDLLNGKENWSLSGADSSIAVDGDELFVVLGGALRSLDAKTGEANWLWEDSSVSKQGTNIIATDNILILSGGEYTYLLDRETQNLLQKLDKSGEIGLANDQLYIASNQSFFAFNISAVPEVNSYAMLLAGLGLILVTRRRQKLM